MKLKNVSVAEKHVEKFVLLIGVLFLFYVAWAYFITNRFSVELNGLPVPPSQIDQTIAERAHTLERNLNGPAPKELIQWESPNYVGLFNAQLTTPPTPPGPDGSTDHISVKILTDGGLNYDSRIRIEDEGEQPISPNNPPFVIPTIPAPSTLVTRSDLGTLDTTAPANTMEILKSFGSQPPLDIQWITVTARVDMAKLTDQLKQPLPPNKQRIPQELWRDKVALIDIQVERRMQNADGSWTDPVLVPPMIGRFSLRPSLGQVTVATATTTIETAKTNQLQIVQPAFYALRNSAWTPPELPEDTTASPGAPGTPADAAALADLRRRLDDANTILARRTQELAANPQSPRARQLQAQIAQIQRNIADLTQKIQAAGGTAPTPAPGAAPGFTPGFNPGFSPDFPPMEQPGMMTGQPSDSTTIFGSLMAQDKFQCWANDFTVAPGKVYQYRMRLVFSNPLYRQPGIPDSQKEIANQFTLASDWSDWSAPVTSIQDSYFFVVAGNSAMHSARVEIWKFYDGLWRKYDDNVSPGDPIGKPTDQYTSFGTPASSAGQPPVTGPQPIVNFSTGTVLVDTDFTYKILLPALNISQTTLRALFVTNGQLTSRTEIADKERRDTLIQQIVPDTAADAGPSDLDRMRDYRDRLDRDKADRASRAPSAPDRTTRRTGPDGFGPPDMPPR